MTSRQATGKADLHWRQVVNVPIGGNLDQASIRSVSQGLHPVFGFLAVVYLGPCISCSQVIGLAVVMRHAVIILDAVIQEKLSTFTRGLPPAPY